MITVEQATAALRLRAQAHWLDWAIGRGTWPLRVQLRPPALSQIGNDLLAVQTWAGQWRAASESGAIPGTVEWVSRRVPGMTTFIWPNRLSVASADQALALFPELRATFERTVTRIDEAVGNPHVAWCSRESAGVSGVRAIAAIADSDWSAALNVIEFLATNAVTDMMVRQLPIPGIGTKWLESPGHAPLILSLMFPDESRDGRDPLTHLIQLVGLRTPSPKMNVTLACAELRASAGGLSHFAASAAVLDASTIKQPTTVLVIENVQPGYTISRDYDGLAVIHGLGKAVSLIGSLRWLHSAERVLYWGDIDRAGLACLDLLRKAGISAHSVLMDNATLDEHLTLCRTTPTQQANYAIPEFLFADEVQLYERLNTYHRTHGVELQLEQERIGAPTIVAAVETALRYQSSDVY